MFLAWVLLIAVSIVCQNQLQSSDPPAGSVSAGAGLQADATSARFVTSRKCEMEGKADAQRVGENVESAHGALSIKQPAETTKENTPTDKRRKRRYVVTKATEETQGSVRRNSQTKDRKETFAGKTQPGHPIIARSRRKRGSSPGKSGNGETAMISFAKQAANYSQGEGSTAADATGCVDCGV